MKKKIKTFSPSIDKTRNINVSKIQDTRKSTYTEKFKEIEDEKGFIKTTMNIGVVLDVLSHKMYPSPESAMRELYMNAIRACQIAKEQYNALPTIEITIDPINRTLVVHEFDSMGITFDEFNESLRVLGESTNFDRTKTGMMGMGFHAYVLISETIKVESSSRKENETMVLMGRRGKGFTNLTAKEQPEHNGKVMDYGVRLTLTWKDTVDPISLVNVIKACAELNGIPTRVDIKDDIRKKGVDGAFLKEILARKEVLDCTLTNISETCTASYKKDRKERGQRDSVKDKQITYDVSTKDYDICGMIAIEKESYNDNVDVSDRFGHIETRLCGVPIRNDLVERFQKLLNKDITSRHMNGMFNWILINLKNEGKYPPVTTREELSKENSVELDDLVHVIEQLWISYLQTLTFNSFHEYAQSKHEKGNGKAIVFDKFKEGEGRRNDLDGISDYERQLISIYNMKVIRYEGLYKSTTKTRLGELVVRSNRTILLRKLDKNKIQAIEDKLNSFSIPNQMSKGFSKVQLTLETDVDGEEEKKIDLQGTYINFPPKEYNEYQIEANVKLMEKFGIVMGDDMLKHKDLKIKPTRSKRKVNTDKEVTWHFSQASYRTEGYRNDPMIRKDTVTCTIDETNDGNTDLHDKTLVQLDTTTPMRMFSPLMQCLSKYAVTKKCSGLDAQLSSELVDELKPKILKTTRGDMTIQQIVSSNCKVYMFAYDDLSIVDKIGDKCSDGEFIVIGTHDNIFEVMLVLLSNGHEFPFSYGNFELNFDYSILRNNTERHGLEFTHHYMPPFYLKLIELNADHDLEVVELVLKTQQGWIDAYDELQVLIDRVVHMEGRIRHE